MCKEHAEYRGYLQGGVAPCSPPVASPDANSHYSAVVTLKGFFYTGQKTLTCSSVKHMYKYVVRYTSLQSIAAFLKPRSNLHSSASIT